MLITPALALSALVSTIYGAVFHLWRGGGLIPLLRYLAAAWLGFALGQLAAWLGGWRWLMIGQVHILEGTLGSLALLALTEGLTTLLLKPNQAPRS